MIITREWAMPNKRTFTIKPIKRLLEQQNALHFQDPFPYVKSRLEFVDALDYLSMFPDNSQDGVLFDPPYSLRQLKECYNDLGRYITGEESRLVYTKWKDEIARVIKPGGKCISFGWNSNGLGACRGFEIDHILLVPHGGPHNDTIVTIETKVQTTLTRPEVT